MKFYLLRILMKKANYKGFSLIEILFVISIFFILVSTSFSRLSFLNRFVVKSEVDNLFNTFSFLRQKAISSNCEQRLFFDLQNNSYFYFLNNKKVNHSLANPVKFDFLPLSLGPPSAPIKPIKSAITFKKDKNGLYGVIFYSNGQMDTGTVYFVDKNYKSMFALTSPISQVCYIRKYRHQKNRWIVI